MFCYFNITDDFFEDLLPIVQLIHYANSGADVAGPSESILILFDMAFSQWINLTYKLQTTQIPNSLHC